VIEALKVAMRVEGRWCAETPFPGVAGSNAGHYVFLTDQAQHIGCIRIITSGFPERGLYL
jgi:hypothetical protein